MSEPQAKKQRTLRISFPRDESGKLRVAVTTESDEGDAREWQPRLKPAQADAALAATADADHPAVRRSGELEVADPAQDVGGRLFEAVFGGRLGSLYRQEAMRARDERAPLELRIAVNGLEGDAWPWELLYDFMVRGDFVVLAHRWSLVREPGPGSLAGGLKAGGKLRAMVVAPAGARGSASALLDDFAQLQSENGTFEYEVVESRGYAAPVDAVGSGFQIVHVVAPGAGPAILGQLQDLGERSDVQLVILEGESPRGITAELGRFVPATICMHLPMLEAAAATFWRALYRELLDGSSLGAAVGAARKAIDHETPGSRQWALPVLSIAGADGPLLEPERSQDKEASRGRAEPRPPKAAGRSAVELEIATRNRDALKRRAAGFEGDVPDFVSSALADAEAAVARLTAQIRDEARS